MPIDTLVADPTFQALDVGKKREVLSRFDPAFSNLTDAQVGEFTLKAQKSFNADTVPINPNNPRPATLKGKTKTVTVPRPWDDRIADLYPIIGGAGGEFVGGPPGAMVGGGVGETIKQIPTIIHALKGRQPEQTSPLLQNPNPSPVQQPPSILPSPKIDTDALKGAIGSIISESLVQGGFSKGAKWLGNMGAELKAAIKNHSSLERIIGNLPIEGNFEDAKALADSGMPHTVSQQTGNRTLNFLEGATAPKNQRVALKNSQDSYIDQKLAQFRVRFGVPAGPGVKPYSDLGDMTETQILKRQAAAKKSVGKAYDAFDVASANEKQSYPVVVKPEETVGDGFFDPKTGQQGTKVIPAQVKYVDVDRPIYLDKNSGKLIDRLLPELNTVVDTLSQTPSDPAFSGLNKLRITLTNLKNGVVVDGQKIMPYDAVKQLRTDINNAIRYDSHLDRAKGTMAAIRDTLGSDIDNSISKYWRNKGALKQLKVADALHSETEDIFNEKVMASIKEGHYDRVDPSQVYKSAMSNPDRAREIIRALGPEEQRMAKGHFFAALDAKAGSNPNAILNQLESPSYREVFSAHDHKDLTDFFRAQRRVQEFSSDAGNQAGLIWRKAGVGIALAGGAGNVATGGESNISNYAMAGGLLMVGGREFASRILLNPKYARAAGRLTRIAPTSEEATFLRRVILTGMRGTEATVKYENGKTMRVKINANGEPVPLNDQ